MRKKTLTFTSRATISTRASTNVVTLIGYLTLTTMMTRVGRTWGY